MTRLQSAIGRRIACIAMFVALPAALFPAASAQVVSGVVRSGGVGVPGVHLLFRADADSASQLGVVSRSDGSYRASVSWLGATTIQIRAIGFRPIERKITVTGSTGLVLLDIELEPARVELADLDVTARSPDCRRSTVGMDQLSRVIEVLTVAASVMPRALEHGSYRFDSRLVRREVYMIGRRDSTVREDSVMARLTSWPVAAPSHEMLRTDGFARRLRGGEGDGWYFAGLDLAVLTSDWFLGSHCVWVDRDDGQEGMISVRFEPSRRRRSIVDIEGGLEIDRVTATLRRLWFVLVNLPSEMPKGSASGELQFAALGDGTWYPESWRMRVPIIREGRIARPIIGNISPSSAARSSVVGYAEESGKVVKVEN